MSAGGHPDGNGHIDLKTRDARDAILSRFAALKRMILVIDVGNTRLKWGWLDGTLLSEQQAVVHREIKPEIWSGEIFEAQHHPDRVLIAFYANDVDDVYMETPNAAAVVTEKPERACELELAGMPLCLRATEHGELVSYFHLHLALKNQDAVLGELRRRGIIVTSVGPFTNFRDPEGRVIKLTEERVAIA